MQNPDETQASVPGGGDSLDGIVLPTAYRINAERALARYPERAANYFRHTLIGDPPWDGILQELAPLPGPEVSRFIQAGMEQQEDVMRDAPRVLRNFFIDSPPPDPPWLDRDAFGPGVRAFQRNAIPILSAFVTGVLLDGFATLISTSFTQTGRIFDNGVWRLKQNNRHQVEIFFPGGLERYGDGWKLSVRIRIVHAQIRRLLAASEEWDADELGVPVSAAHLGYAAACFAARSIKHSEALGARYTREERESYHAVWRYAGHLMGIPDTILFTDEDDANMLHQVGSMCEPPPTDEAVLMTNALINSAPLVAGITDPDARKALVHDVIYPIARALIGNRLADQLRFPKSTRFAVLFLYRMNNRFQRLVAKLRGKEPKLDAFGSLLEASAYDSAGLSYKLPDHVHAERSSQW